MKSTLPHLHIYNDLGPQDAITAARVDRRHTCYFAVSDDFYEHDSSFAARIFPAYKNLYKAKKAELSAYFGYAPRELDFNDADYPEWADGGPLAMWDQDRLYLQIAHHDRDTPIMVFLAQFPDD